MNRYPKPNLKVILIDLGISALGVAIVGHALSPLEARHKHADLPPRLDHVSEVVYDNLYYQNSPVLVSGTATPRNDWGWRPTARPAYYPDWPSDDRLGVDDLTA